MGKQTVKEKPKVLFSNVKHSNTTVNTYSKTLSSLSQSCTKSLIMQLKKKIPDNNYYEDNGVLKRDLSIETDICILRRYYRANKNKIQTKQPSSARSKYSINNTEIETITELKADSSACGDSEPATENTKFNVDLTTLVVDNLKSLLNDWIKNYLLENDETKQKIETVLDSILHKVELEQSSSSCTYNLDITVKKDAYQDDNSLTTEVSDHNKISSLTIPLIGKQLKLISTLSVPKRTSNASKKFKRTRFQPSYTNKPSRLHIASSHLNVLEITTESFTKRFATYQPQRNEKAVEYYTVHNNRPQSSRTTVSSGQFLKNNDIDINEEYLKRSLKRKSKKVVQQNSVMNKIEKSLSGRHHLQTKNVSIEEQLGKYKSSEIKVHRKRAQRKYHRKKNIRNKKFATYPKYPNIREKKFAFLYKKSCNRLNQQREFIKHVKKVFKYFDRSKYVSNIKVNIQVNVFSNTDTENDSSVISHVDNICKYDEETTFLYNVKPKKSSAPSTEVNESNKLTSLYSNNQLKLITLLDGAASQAKYLTGAQTLQKKCNNSIESVIKKKDKRTDTSGIEIAQDLGEIKTIIKDLSNLAQNIVKEHLSEKSKAKTDDVKRDLEVSNKDLSKKSRAVDTKESKGIQCSNLETKNVFTSGLKLRKGPKQKDAKNDDLHARLTKRSTSYRIIESESVLKVHDMTSAADVEEGSIERYADKALTCSLPKSKSLFEMSTGTNNRKLLAFYCDDCFKPAECVYDNKRHIPYTSEICSFCPDPRHLSTLKYCSRQCSEELNPLVIQCNNKNCKNMSQDEPECDNDNSTSSVYIEIDNTSCDKKFVVRKRSVSFREGCFYCTLLWIPVLVISWFFYVFTLKGLIASKQNTKRLAESTSMPPFPISLTDLGF